MARPSLADILIKEVNKSTVDFGIKIAASGEFIINFTAYDAVDGKSYSAELVSKNRSNMRKVFDTALDLCFKQTKSSKADDADGEDEVDQENED